jgi:hypothetical protein
MPILILLFLAAVVIAAAAFPDEVRRAVAKANDAIDTFLSTVQDLAERALRKIWGAVKPTPPPIDTPVQPIEGLRVALGVFILLLAAGLVVANYFVLLPTIAILLPMGHGGEFLAGSMVALGTAVGILLHTEKRRFIYRMAALSIILVVGFLSLMRGVAISDGDLYFAGLAALLAALLQGFEILAVAGGLNLAGRIVPVMAALPLLAILGAIWLTTTALIALNIHGVLSEFIDATVGVLERGLNALLAGLATGTNDGLRSNSSNLTASPNSPIGPKISRSSATWQLYSAERPRKTARPNASTRVPSARRSRQRNTPCTRISISRCSKKARSS